MMHGIQVQQGLCTCYGGSIPCGATHAMQPINHYTGLPYGPGGSWFSVAAQAPARQKPKKFPSYSQRLLKEKNRND